MNRDEGEYFVIICFIAGVCFALSVAGCSPAKVPSLTDISNGAAGIGVRAGVIVDTTKSIVGHDIEKQVISSQAVYITKDAQEIGSLAETAAAELQTERNWRIYEQQRAGQWFSPVQHKIFWTVVTVVGVVGSAIGMLWLAQKFSPLSWFGTAGRFVWGIFRR